MYRKYQLPGILRHTFTQDIIITILTMNNMARAETTARKYQFKCEMLWK